MKIKHLLALILATAIWGFNFSGIKVGLESFDAFTLNAIRFFLCAVPFVFFVKKPNIPLYLIAGYGLLFGVGLWGMVSLSIHLGVSSGVASLVLQFSAFITVIWGYLFLKETINIGQIVGFLIAMVGLVVIASVADGSVTTNGFIVVLFAALNLSLAVLMLKLLNVKQVFAFLVWACLFPPIPLLLIAYFVNGDMVFTSILAGFNLRSVLSIALQVYPATLFAYWIWNRMVILYPISLVAPISLLIPIFGFIGSNIMFDEQIGTAKIISCFLITLGLAVATFGQRIWHKHSVKKQII